MTKVAKISSLVCAMAALVISCAGSASPPDAPSSAPAEPSAAPAPSSADDGARPALSAEACEASGGLIVGDIGDGAIHRPEYRCSNGAKPSGSIRAAAGGPIAIEGSVCCPR